MLSNLQQQIATILAGLDQATGFVMAGGGALVVHGAVDRPTRDLDYFTTDPAQVDQLLPALEQALRSGGLHTTIEQASPGFARLLVAHGHEQTRVDLATDARLLPPESSEFGQLLSTRELAVDKVLAIFGRAEARDFVDLAALEPDYGLRNLCDLAKRKDLGFQPDIFCQMLERFDRLPRDEFDIPDSAHQQLKLTITCWAEILDDST